MLATLRSRLALTNLLLTLLGLAAVVFVFTQLLSSQREDVKRTELRHQSQAVALMIERLFKQHAGAGAPLADAVDSASSLLQERIIVLGPDGRRVNVDSAKHTPFEKGSWHAFDVQSARQGKTYTATLASKNLILFQTPLRSTRNPHRLIGAVVLVARVGDVRPDPATLFRVMLIAIVTALLVWLLIGVYFTYTISRPLLRITSATRQMARGNYATRVHVRGHGEIARLAGSFNSMARQVQQSNQVLKDFLGNVSHDLRTPLTMIAGFSQALMDGTARQEDTSSSAEVIHDEALKMQGLVDDLMQLTRLESGLLTLERHSVEARPFVQHCMDRIARSQVDRPHATLRNVIPSRLPPMNIDAERLERALRNLLDNALEYTPPGGAVTVDARLSGSDTIEISVSDTGRGIPQEDLPRIFERFYRSDKSRERVEGKGHSGLGLAIVRETVEAHGGSVRVESKLGLGTTFYLTVPRAQIASPQSERASGTEAAPRAAAR